MCFKRGDKIVGSQESKTIIPYNCTAFYKAGNIFTFSVPLDASNDPVRGGKAKRASSPHSTDKETEVWRGWEPHLRLHTPTKQQS